MRHRSEARVFETTHHFGEGAVVSLQHCLLQWFLRLERANYDY